MEFKIGIRKVRSRLIEPFIRLSKRTRLRLCVSVCTDIVLLEVLELSRLSIEEEVCLDLFLAIF